jgi:hypothetical protein
MRMKKFVPVALLLLLAALPAAAQGVHSPEKGSAERTSILDALRVPVERELKQKVVFVVENINVSGNWAFVSGTPQSANGGELNLRGTKYWEAEKNGAFGGNYFALLKKTGGNWKVVTYRIGCTDVCYLTWPHDYRAPKTIFPYTE